MRGPEQIYLDLRLLRVARFPEQEPGVSLDYLLQLTHRRHIESVWRSVTSLTAIEYLDPVTLSDGSIGFALTELAVKEEGLLPADAMMLVRLASEAMVIRFGQLVALSDLSENKVQTLLASLVRRGFLKKEKDSSGKELVYWPTRLGLAEAGFIRHYFQERPAKRQWGHTLKVTDVRAALVDEFIPKSDKGSRKWGNWQWLSERARSRFLLRTEQHMPDGFWVHGRDFSLATEIAISFPDGDQLEATMKELSRDNTEVRYYTDHDTVRNKIERTLEKLQLDNVSLREMPGPAV